MSRNRFLFVASIALCMGVYTAIWAGPPFHGTIFINPKIVIESDPSVFKEIRAAGSGNRRMFDRRINNWSEWNAFLFIADFTDGTSMEIQLNPEFQQDEAEFMARKYAKVIGQLPMALRVKVKTVSIHKGVVPFGGGNENLLIHTGQAAKYEEEGILEETLIHEACHTSLDQDLARSPDWKIAQKADDAFISDYARDNPLREDVAESFLPYFAIRYASDRIPESLRETIVKTIPNRIAYFDTVGFRMEPVGTSSGSKQPMEDRISIENLSSEVHIPFTLTESNNISIEASINESAGLQLMFHTAVDSVSLTNEALEKIPALARIESMEVQSWGGKSQAEVSKGNSLKIGSLHWQDQLIFTSELSGPGTDGKFGPDLFQGKILHINYDKSELVIYPKLPPFLMDPNSTYRRFDVTLERGAIYLTGDIAIGESRVACRFMVHSGFGGTLLLDDEFVRKNNLLAKLETIGQRELKDSFGNVIKTKMVKLSTLEFDAFQFSDVPVEIFDGSIGSQKVSVLGGKILKRFNIVIDHEHKHIYLSRSRYFDE